jgi:predicted DNA-binding protein with PD1-like motif
MAVIEVENNSGQVVRLTMDEGSEQHEYLRKLARRDDLRRVDIVNHREPATRKTAASK